MNCISIKSKRDHKEKADLDNARDGTFCTLRHGGILLRSGARSRTIDDVKEAAAFLAKVRDKGTGYVKLTVKSYFEPALA